MLLQFNIINTEPSRNFTRSAKEVAGKLFQNFIKMLSKCVIVEETEYFSSFEAREDVEEEMPSTSACDEDYVPPTKKIVLQRVPFDIKLKIVMTANEHPNWSFKTLQSRFKQHLRHNSDIARFRKEILTGGTFQDKLDRIKTNIYDRFLEARLQKQLVTRR